MPRSKRPRVNGRLDSDSDEEKEVEKGMNYTQSHGVRVSSHKLVSPRKRKPAERLFPTTAPSDVQPEPNQAAKKEQRKQGASASMKSFIDNMQIIQSTILANGFDSCVQEHCPCRADAPLALYRCLDCWLRRPACDACLRTTHQHLPFHRIEKWNGKFFEKSSLNDVDLILSLGHYGHRCPNRAKSSQGRATVVVDIGGIHHVAIEFCYCRDAIKEPFQLLQHGLFPATIDLPQTVFTFRLLKDFHLQTLASKKSAYDHYAALQRHTDNVFPQNTPDRRREFQRVGRVWRTLTMIRRSGQAHGIDKVISMRRPGSCAVRCPACIEPGVNITLKELSNISSQDMHRYMLFLSADGNFRLQRKIKVDDPDDVALLNGSAYFVENTAYDAFLRQMGVATDDERSTCANLNVVHLQNVLKFKHCVVSGVDAIQCGRHGLFRAQGMVDLQKGEKFCNTDYALMSALLDCKSIPYFKFSYDIFCQYIKNFPARVAASFPTMVDIASRIDGLVPKMHIMGHTEDCQLQYSFNTTSHVGRTCRETIETAWAEGNQAAGSTKEMNAGHRHDILDDFHGYWNWQKVIAMPRSLYRQHTNAATMYRQTSIAFDALCKHHGPTLINEWSAMDCKPVVVNGKLTSVYVSKAKKGPPTQSTKLQDLLQNETIQVLSLQGNPGYVSVINDGLRLEAEKDRVMKLASIAKPTPAEEERLQVSRIKFRNDLDRWRQRQLAMFPRLQERIIVDEDDEPENINLLLPSSFNEPTRKVLGLENATSLEYELRVGQAHDALRDLRHAIKMFNYNLKFKKDAVFGQGPTTRAQAFLRDLKRDQVGAADKYRRARDALITLGLSESDDVLRPLCNDELWMKDTSKPRQRGDSGKEDPWFWTVVGTSALTKEEQAEWSMESERVKWFRDRADCDRWKEEIEISDQEFINTERSHAAMSKAWEALAGGSDDHGAAAYAHEHSWMYARLANDAGDFYQKALKKVKELC